jgi:hypothetical protein
MASAAVRGCSWCDRQHSGKDQSDNLESFHYSTPSFPDRRAASPGTIIGSVDALSAELMTLEASPMADSETIVRDI